MTKSFEEAILDHYTHEGDELAAANRTAAAYGWAPDASLERSIRTRERDPDGYARWLASDSSGLGAELAMYEAGREAAIQAGTFDPATHQEDAP